MKKQKWLLSLLILFIPLALTGCSSSGNNDGFFHRILVNPMTSLLEFNSDLFNGNYGLGIIMLTIIIRLILLPLMMKQYKTQKMMKSKMDKLKPEMTVIQDKLKKTKDPAKQQELQREMMALYKKHDVNPLNIGCLPMLIQMPILMAVYYAIKGSHEIAAHNFLWYSLGQADHIMAIIAGIIYYVQSVVSMRQMPKEQQATMKIMSFISPLMILFISFSAPAALPLYWSIGGLWMIVQTAVLQNLYKQEPAASDKSVQKN